MDAKSRGTLVLEMLATLIYLCIFGWIAWYWRDLPDRIPTHFGLSGAPDAWGGKWSIVLAPLLFVPGYLILLAFGTESGLSYANYPKGVDSADPRARAVTRSLLRWMRLWIVVLLFTIVHSQLRVARGEVEGLDLIGTAVALAGLLATVGYHVVQLRKLAKRG